jgi:16S rRNA G966 N2-methylase RsmD
VLDPPYGDPAIGAVVERVGRSGMLAPGGFVVLEHGKRLTPPHDPGMLRLRRTRRYGDTAVTIWQHQEDADG